MSQLEMFEQTTPKKTAWTLCVDGASRNNPGPSGAGMYILKDRVLFLKDGYYLGIKTNNQAEYLALFFGLCLVEEHCQVGDEVTIISDSQLLVRQLNGIYRVKQPHLQPLFLLCKTKMQAVNATISHVLRDENSQADAMANQGIEYKKTPPKKYLEQLKQYDIIVLPT